MLKRFFLSERNIIIAITINALVIFLWYFPDLKHEAWLEYLDIFFIIFFLLEAIVKIRVLSWKGYVASNWNRFDLTIVLASLPSLLSVFIPIPNTSLLLVLRLFRLIRVFKFMQFIPNMNSILTGLIRALKASIFVLLVLAFLNFILAIFTCHFYGDAAPEYFGDPAISIYSIFQLFTVEGWNEIPNVIAQAHPDRPWMIGIARTYFVLIVLVGGIFGMSLANAVFVDEMTMDNNDLVEAKIDALHKEISELKKLLIDRQDQV